MAKKILSKKQIKDLVEKVADEAKKDNMGISKIYVFGSYAKARANENSDLDLCFVSSKFKNSIEAEVYLRTKIYNLFSYTTPMDIVAYLPADFNENIPLAREVLKTGSRIL